jgi:hypothetical protein
MRCVEIHDFFLIPLTQKNSVAIYVRSETLYNKDELQLSTVPPIRPLLSVPHPSDFRVPHLWKSVLYTLVGEKNSTLRWS